jgi:hypothetical protein
VAEDHAPREVPCLDAPVTLPPHGRLPGSVDASRAAFIPVGEIRNRAEKQAARLLLRIRQGCIASRGDIGGDHRLISCICMYWTLATQNQTDSSLLAAA